MVKRALVVGAAGGVGLAVSAQLASQDYEVFGTVMDEEQRAVLIQHVPNVAGTAIIDLSNCDGVAAGLAPLLNEATTIDVVAVCTGFAPHGPVETAPLALLRLTYEINTIASVAVYQSVMPLLRRTKGRIALISSMAGRLAFPFIGYYSSSKYALEALGDVMRREAAKWDVDVILIEPGGIKTPMITDQQIRLAKDIANLSDDIRGLYGELYDGFAKMIEDGYKNSTPPEAVATVIVDALVGKKRPEARYVVGSDAAYLCGIARTMSDRDLDKISSVEAATKQREIMSE